MLIIASNSMLYISETVMLGSKGLPIEYGICGIKCHVTDYVT